VLRRLGCFALSICALIVAYGAWQWWGPGPLRKPARVTVAEGSSLASAAELLAYQSAIDGLGIEFRYLARIFGSSDPIQAGEFEIPAGASGAKVLDILQHGRPVVRLVTIPEGMPSILVQEKLAALSELTGRAPLPVEGSVLPNSYDWQAGEARAAVLKRMTDAMDKELARLWAARNGNCPVYSEKDAVILASIVEKETGNASERPMVAGVLCNRLRIGMALGADATTIPVTKGKPLGRMIRRSELAADNGYNTRRKSGLPIGPITNPGRDSIAAVLNPAKTDALYYVADGSGGHVFARTLAEHNANVAKWRAYRKAKGI
jgi:UPF0755 protein